MIIESKPCEFDLTDSQKKDEGTRNVHVKCSMKACGAKTGTMEFDIVHKAGNKVEKFHLVRCARKVEEG
jgi:hypothetical protein